MDSKNKIRTVLATENVFCMIITRGRVYQGLALLTSLFQVMGGDFFLFVHCADDQSYQLFKKIKYKNVSIIRERQLSKQILLLKEKRKIHEYCWTLKPVICEYVLTSYPSINRVTYLDSDLYFFQDPRQIFHTQPDCSVLLSLEDKFNPHIHPAFLRRKEKITGLYNSGFISFKQDKIGLQAMKWWKEKCIEQCRISPKEGLYGDQKYLDDLPTHFPGICNITTPGVNIGPWNRLKYKFSKVNESVYINDHLLIFYHFSGLRVVAKDVILSFYRRNPEKPSIIYQIYKNVISDVIQFVENLDPTFNGFANETDLQRYWNFNKKGERKDGKK